MNTGDWVESCTAVVEHYDGSFETDPLGGDDAGDRLAPTLVEAAIGERAA